MGDNAFLLRMLEPAVRPDARSGALAGLQRHSGTGDPSLPIEQRSFDSLLSEAQAQPMVSAGEQASAPAPVEPAPLASLSQFDRIENDSLRQVIARARA